jgi:hypothetical protein
MMNRSGLSGLLNGARPQPSQGLAHFARGETIVPRQMMDMDPSLRRHAMQSMAMQGRDPQRYQVGGGSGVNPMTGRREFADLVYSDQGWIDPTTGQNADFSAPPANPYSPQPAAGAYDPHEGKPQGQSVAGGIQGRIDAQFGPGGAPDQYLERAPRYDGLRPAAPTRDRYINTGGIYDGAAGYSQPSAANNFNNGVSIADQPGLDAYEQQPAAPSLDGWQNPATYDAWRANRNPQGKGVAEQYYGQAVDQGTQMGLGALVQTTGQMPAYSSAGWGTPGVALGDAIDNSADKVSILNSGYNQGSMLDAYGALAGAGWGNANGGISGAGGPNGMSGQRSNQPPRNYAASFQY